MKNVVGVSTLRRLGGHAYDRLFEAVSCRLSGRLTPKEKARTLIEYGLRHGVRTLIETGTYHGNTVAACVGHFDRIYTIELDRSLSEAAGARFADEPTVTVVHGDSYTELTRLARGVPDPTLFWLDAHYSAGETAKGPHDPPLPWELRSIRERGQPDVILIDDARLMGVAPGYPSLDEIRELLGGRISTLEVRRDIIRMALAP